MSDATIVTLGEGIVAALNAVTFSQSFTATYEFAPVYSAIDAKTLRVVVTDAGGDIELLGRNQMQFADSMRVVIIYNIQNDNNTGIDTDKLKEMLYLSEEISQFLIRQKIANYSPVGRISRTVVDKEKAHYLAGNLDERLFISSLTIEYRTRISAIRPE